MRYMYYCLNCGFLGSDEGETAVNHCPECGHVLYSTHVSKDVWKTKDEYEKELLTRKWVQVGNGIPDTRCTSSDSFPDAAVQKCLGFLTGESSYATNGSIGGMVSVQEDKFERAFSVAKQSLKEKAYAIGANAVIGMRVTTTVITHEQLILVVVSGTAVKIGS